ncbi:MAG: alcohol dehydrogenase catalytic domain-containing protein, partial [Chlamydiia bacterium]|nr:alcohol dehydrogenase catalytic domain-containing protein [Chlamydiia bacterium]
MRALVLEKLKAQPHLADVPKPSPSAGELLLKVHCCGLCRTDLHIRDGELKPPKLPLILGHQIVGTVAAVGEGVDPALIGTRRGAAWLAKTCGTCPFCLSGRENLCDFPLFTGFSIDGGFAEFACAF